MAVSGLSSGSIDVTTVVSQLMAVEHQPVDKLNNKSTAYQTQLSVFAGVKSNISTFQTAVQKLKSSGAFQAYSVNVSDNTTLSATAGSTAVTGSYSLEISSLARSQQLIAAGQSSSSATIGAGGTTTLSFDFGSITGGTLDTGTGTYSGASFNSNGGGVKTVTIDSTNNTLEGMRDAINAAGIGVTATIINDGGTSPYRLALSSSDSGVTNSMSISVSGDSAISSLLSNDPAGTQNLSQTQAAQNANFKVNGVAITKTSNTVTDAIQGVTLNLTKETSAPTLLNISKDTSAITDAANSFVTAYNDLYTTLKSLSAYKTSSSSAGSLAGDPAVRQMIGELQDILAGSATGGAFANLSEVGINSVPGKGLVLDSTKFNSAVSNNLKGLSDLFTSDTGFATKFDAWAKTSLNVTIATRTSNINSYISNISNQVDLMETRLKSVEKRYTDQFTHLNSVLASFSSQQTFVTNLNKSTSS